jgi:hypothetical protein
MTWLRHAGRHVHHTAANYLSAQLEALGWTAADAAERPFGGTQVVMWTKPAILAEGALVDQVAAGVLAITLGDEAYPQMQEMGGPLSTQEYPLFVDIFHDTEETTLALATDVRDIFMGRLPGTQPFLDVVNQANQVSVPGWRMEFEDIERVRPESKIRLHWQVVKVTATTFFPEERY